MLGRYKMIHKGAQEKRCLLWILSFDCSVINYLRALSFIVIKNLEREKWALASELLYIFPCIVCLVNKLHGGKCTGRLSSSLWPSREQFEYLPCELLVIGRWRLRTGWLRQFLSILTLHNSNKASAEILPRWEKTPGRRFQLELVSHSRWRYSERW